MLKVSVVTNKFSRKSEFAIGDKVFKGFSVGDVGDASTIEFSMELGDKDVDESGESAVLGTNAPEELVVVFVDVGLEADEGRLVESEVRVGEFLGHKLSDNITKLFHALCNIGSFLVSFLFRNW